MSKDLVSVVVAAYNVGKYLEKCVDSIVSQDYDKLEIILVDDGSKDNTGDLCDKYAEHNKRIKVIHQKNGGLSNARNSGIKAAHGKYITFIDGDDYVDKTYISSLLIALIDNKADISVAGHTIVRPNKSCDKISSSKLLLKPREALFEILYDRNIDISSWGKLYKTSLFSNISFPDGQLFEDSATTYKLFMAAKSIAVIPESHYFYIIREGSITNAGFSEKKLDLLKSTRDMAEDILISYPDLKQACARRMMWAHLSTLSQLAKMRKPDPKIKKELMGYIMANRKAVLADEMIQKRDRLALRSCAFGYTGFKLVWALYGFMRRH